MKYQIIRHWNGAKGYGKKFDTIKEAKEFLQNDEKVQMDKENGFTFSINAIADEETSGSFNSGLGCFTTCKFC